MKPKAKTSQWVCHKVDSCVTLGFIKWYGAWRQYCFFPEGSTIFNKGCMLDVTDFIDQLMEERRNK